MQSSGIKTDSKKLIANTQMVMHKMHDHLFLCIKKQEKAAITKKGRLVLR